MNGTHYEKNNFDQYENTCVSAIKSKNPYKNSKTKIKGVYWDEKRNKYVAQIMFQKKRYYLGRYISLDDAAAARKTAEENLHDKFIEWYEIINIKDIINKQE